MLKILLLVLLVNLSAHAGIFEVEWGCPKTFVQVSFNDQGKMQFKPDVVNGKLKSGNAEETAASRIFRKKCKMPLRPIRPLIVRNQKKIFVSYQLITLI